MADFEQDVVIARIKNRRGNRVDLPQPLAAGEFGFALDTKQLFIGLDDENTLTGVDLHLGEPVSSQDTVNSVLAKQIFEFDLRPEQLNVNKPLVSDPDTLIDELDVLDQLLTYSSTTYVLQTRKDDITALEAEVKLLADVTNEIKQIMLSESIAPETYSILYDWIPLLEVDQPKAYVDPDTTGLDKTTSYYVFTFHLGLDYDTGSTPPEIDEPTLDRIKTKLNAIPRVDIQANMPGGVTTLNPGADLAFNRGKEMVSGFLPMPTGRQSSNIAAIVNVYATPSGLVNTKQNVEILTEFVNLGDDPDKLIDSLIEYKLNPNTQTYNDTLPLETQLPPTQIYPLFTPVSDSTNFALIFSLAESDVAGIEYSATTLDASFKEFGQLNVVASAQMQLAELSKTSNSIRQSPYASTADDGPNIDFKAVYISSNNTVEIQYRHNFDVPVTLKLLVKRWLSSDT